jgi:hypothetical protein
MSRFAEFAPPQLNRLLPRNGVMTTFDPSGVLTREVAEKPNFAGCWLQAQFRYGRVRQKARSRVARLLRSHRTTCIGLFIADAIEKSVEDGHTRQANKDTYQ